MENFNTIFIEKSTMLDCSNKGNISLKKLMKDREVEIDQFLLEKQDRKKIVALIGGGMAAEREVSLMSSCGIADSLLELGYQIIFINMGSDIANVLAALKPDIVYNALHGTYGEDGCLQGMLNIMRIPYTGPGVMSSALAMNKKKSAEIFRANNIKIAKSILVKKSDNIKQDPIPRPYVIKPLSQGSSVGIEVIFEEDDFNFAKYDFPYGEEILIEEFIKGKEIQVAILDGKAIGALEVKINADKRFYDYEVKYTEGFAEHIMPAPIADDIYKKALLISEKACNVFEINRGIIRAEFLYQEQQGELYMLEINTHPGMTPMSICPEILEYEGCSYTQLVQKIIEGASFEK